MSSRARRRAFVLGVALVVAAWFVLPSLCRGPMSPEDQVRAAIVAVADGAGEADIVAALAPVSRQYSDPQGADFAIVRGLLFREFHARGPISTTLGPIDVDLGESGEVAEARFVCLLMEGIDLAALDIKANNADAWHFSVQLRLEDGDWMITSHTRRGVAPQDVFR